MIKHCFFLSKCKLNFESSGLNGKLLKIENRAYQSEKMPTSIQFLNYFSLEMVHHHLGPNSRHFLRNNYSTVLNDSVTLTELGFCRYWKYKGLMAKISRKESASQLAHVQSQQLCLRC